MEKLVQFAHYKLDKGYCLIPFICMKIEYLSNRSTKKKSATSHFWNLMMDTLQILFLLVLLLPVLGTALSLVLADNTTQVIFK